MKLSLLTINLHCFAEDNIAEKQAIISKLINDKQIDIVFLQEVSQQRSETDQLHQEIHNDNYGLALKNILKSEYKESYYFYYESIKRSFDIYDEGVGILSKYPLDLVLSKIISKTDDYDNWKRRKILAYRINNIAEDITIATTHFGWSDGYEVFEKQFVSATEELTTLPLTILGGDFNITYQSNEYDFIKSKGWLDVFETNKNYLSKQTFIGDEHANQKQVRLDYILTNKPITLLDQEIVFINERVSDHFGVYVLIQTDRPK